MKINCHCFLYNKNLEDLGVPTQDELARVSFDISEVQCVRECIDDKTQEISQNECIIYFKGGAGSLNINKSFNFINSLLK